MRDAGLEVDLRLGMSHGELLDAVRGASALVIRSATQVTADVLEVADALVVVGRAGIGLDNVDVEAATRRGVMVVNAPQSNVLSAAEHTSRSCSPRRATSRRPTAISGPGSGTARWEGVELHDKTLGIVGLGRVGVLVAQRAAFGMQLAGVRPLRERGSRPPARCRSRADGRARARGRLPHHPPAEDPRHPGPDLGRAAHAREARRCASSTPRAASSTRPRSPTRCARAGSPAPRSTCSSRAHHRVAAVRARQRGGHAAPRRVDRRGAGQGRPDHRRAGRARAARRVRALRGQPRRERGERDGAAVPAAGRAPRRLFTALAGGAVDTLEISYEGQIADYDCRVLTLSVLKGVLGPGRRRAGVVRERAAARRRRGSRVRETTSSSARDYVNLIELRGHTADAARTSPARSTASRTRRASSRSTTTSSTCRRRATCSSCATSTRRA